MMRAVIMAVTGLAAVQGAADAQDFGGAVSLGYGLLDSNDVDLDGSVLSLVGSARANFGNGFSLGGDLLLNSYDVDGVPGNVGTSTFQIDGSYRFSQGFSVGGYVEQSAIDLDDLGIDLDLDATSYGLTFGYSAGGTALGAFVGATQTDPDLPAGSDVTDYGLTFRYAQNADFALGVTYLQTTYSDDAGDADVSLFGLGGVYAINDAWSVFGGFARGSIDIVDTDATSFGVGASYDLSRATQLNATVSLEYVGSDIEISGLSGDGSLVRMGLNFPLGKGTARLPLTSVAGNVLNPRRSAVTSALLTGF